MGDRTVSRWRPESWLATSAISLSATLASVGVSQPAYSQDAGALRSFALNALFVPLLEDDVPPRWRGIEAMRCGVGSKVTVDGKALAVGDAVPANAFVLAWSMVDCRPLEPSIRFDGEVSVTIFPDDAGGYSAVVEPKSLRLASGSSAGVWTERFSAVTP